jgi:GDPmannose 4,6-dehydratase
MTKKALITGIGGQDGTWLAKSLLEKGYEVYGAVRKEEFGRLENLKKFDIESKINFVPFDLFDQQSIIKAVQTVKPDEFYNLAAQSYSGDAFEWTISIAETNGLAVAYILDAIYNFSPKTRLFQASTSQMFKDFETEEKLNENTPLEPKNPYATSKLYGHWIVKNYRESYENLFVVSGILFNHESELRPANFVTRKISSFVAGFSKGLIEAPLELGNLDAERDWGYAPEYVEAMQLMLQGDEPKDYVIATGESIKIRDFVTKCFEVVGIDLKWEGQGLEEVGIDTKTGETLVKVNPDFYRKGDQAVQVGDASEIKKDLGWEATKKVGDIAKILVEYDLSLLK